MQTEKLDTSPCTQPEDQEEVPKASAPLRLRNRDSSREESHGVKNAQAQPQAVCNKKASKYVKQKLTDMKREIDYSIIIAGDFYTSQSSEEP